MDIIGNSNRAPRGRRSAALGGIMVLGVLVIAAASPLSPAMANDFGENTAWQFRTTADKANLAAVEDMRLRKRGGYYDSFRTVYNNYNTTNIGRQINCNVAATATGNSGSNGMDSNVSSPNTSNSGSNSANSTGNSSSNGNTQDGPSGVVAGEGGGSTAGIDNTQGNSGNQSSGVSDSGNDISSGPINAGGGNNSQVINSDQGNNGSQSANISDSIACSLASAGPLN